MTLSQTENSKLEDARTVGGDPSVTLSYDEMLNLLKITADDLGLEIPDNLSCEECDEKLQDGFFNVEIDDLHCAELESTVGLEQLTKSTLGEYTDEDPDVVTYFALLAQLHSYRRKFNKVLNHQDIPELQTVIPRGLLELGNFDEEKIVSWLTWRKFLYDIDNRSGQNAGYLFENIIAEAIGGKRLSGRKSPISRANKDGSRQVDCLKDDTAYEFKMRVTEAASGKGRQSEEEQFAEDASTSGYTPILLVLDPTPSAKRERLRGIYEDYGGEAYVGEDAWEHLDEKAGPTMSNFLQKYVRSPISDMDENEDKFEDIAIAYGDEDDSVTVTVGDKEIQLR
jgi:hypothetical protein